jgi:hypothetical protein
MLRYTDASALLVERPDPSEYLRMTAAGRTHLKRWLFNIAAGASLLLCVASVVMWVRSGDIVDAYVAYDDHGVGRGITSMRGQLIYSKVWVNNPRPAHTLTRSSAISAVADSDWGFLGFFYNDTRGSHGFGNFYSRWIKLCVPYWALTLASAVLPVIGGRRVLRMLVRRRRGPGLCPVCGYDLRATPDRCPECGKITSSAARE